MRHATALVVSLQFAHCLGLYAAISSQFTLEVCTAAENRKKHQNTLFWKVKVIQNRRCQYC